MVEYGFNYRGNGYGFWPTWDEAAEAAHKKRLADHSAYVRRSGRPFAIMWLCVDKEPVRPFLLNPVY